MAIELNTDIGVDYIESDVLQQKNIRLGILRLDKLHPLVSGNKWYKLKDNISKALALGKKGLLTFGGAYSNHLIATAAAAQAFGLGSKAIVRGFHAQENLSPTLMKCASLGMELQFVSREEYDKKNDESYLHHLHHTSPNHFIIPEGGDNQDGINGAAAIAELLPQNLDMVTLPIGTGTTFCGIRNGLSHQVKMLGFPTMKGGDYLSQHIQQHVSCNNWVLHSNYHFGGFAKHKPALIEFMNNFYHQHKIPLDFVYTAKMMFGIFDLINKDELPNGTRLVCIHTGGLQGNDSIKQLLHY